MAAQKKCTYGSWFKKDYVKVMGDKWRIDKIDSIEDVDRKGVGRKAVYGQTAWDDGTIRIWNGKKTLFGGVLCPEYFKTFYMKTIMHEVLHIIAGPIGLERILVKHSQEGEDPRIEEDVIDALAMAIVNFLVDNDLIKE
jgi:hypothetical protein